MTSTRRECIRSAGLLSLTFLPLWSWADDYLKRPFTIVVPFPPGGIADPVARLVAQKLGDALGQPVIVDSKPGAASQVAASAVKNLPPDGHTLFMGNMGSQSLNPHLFSKLSYGPNDFAPVAPLIQTPHWLIVHRDSPLNSVADLIAQSKSKAGGLTFASQGVGSGGQLLGELFKLRASIEGVHVPYKGAAPAVQDLLANRFDYMFDAVSTSLPHVKDGRLRVLAVASTKRLPQAPDAPTMAEIGYPGIELSFWFGLLARAGTSDATVMRLNRELGRIVQLPAFQDATVPHGLEPVWSSPADFALRIQGESQRWGKVIRDAKISAD